MNIIDYIDSNYKLFNKIRDKLKSIEINDIDKERVDMLL